jgi:hypothetical protein
VTRDQDGYWQLSSGRRINPAFNVIGLCIDEAPTRRHEVTAGSDQQLCAPTANEWHDDGDPEIWTADEKRELADHMIAEWKRFRDAC